MKEQLDAELKSLNTLALPCKVVRSVCFDSSQEVVDFFKSKDLSLDDFVILGSGSNMVLPEVLGKTVLRFMFNSISYRDAGDDLVLLEVEAGCVWDQLVAETVEKGLSGLENLSYIPGTVGAAPVQNIGAYGVELSDILVSVRVFDTQEKSLSELSNEQCKFSYRDSLFKQQSGRYCILGLTLSLSKKAVFKLTYGELKGLQSLGDELSVSLVRDKVIEVRKEKLPEPQELPNAGSFFKNPVVSAQVAAKLKKDFPDLVSYELESGDIKLAAGWLIDQAGWKGRRQGPVGVHAKQALVLVNYGGANQGDVLTLANAIRDSIFTIFSVSLEIEPKVIQPLSVA